MDKPLWAWGGFFGVVLLLLVFDLGLFHRRERDITIRESLWLSAFYVAVSIAFGIVIFHFISRQAGRDFFTGYLIEKSLSMDNIFVMSLVFSYFAIPTRYQHRVLFWGILGVVLLRGLMIGAGVALIHEFGFVLYVFGAFLLFTGIRMLFTADKQERGIEDNKILRWLRGWMKVTPKLHGNRFFVRDPSHAGKGRAPFIATPLFMVLVFIELADMVFAVDSVPAVFAVTIDPFIVYTSNIFAILGLRAMYFMLAAMLHRFAYLKYALALVLVFIGGKILLVPLIGKIPSTLSLAVTLTLLLGGVALSWWKTRGDAQP